MAQALKERPGYFPALDGLRLLASLNIVLMHLNSSWCLGTVHQWPVINYLVKGPAFSATLFFVLGGFIFFHQLSAKADTFHLGRFLWSRFRKLYPLHVLTLALMLFVVVYREQFQGDWAFLIKSALMHLSLLWAFDPLNWLSLNEPSWALTPFFLAYATLGFLLKPLSRESRTPALLGILFLTLVPSIVFSFVYVQIAKSPNAYAQFHVFPLLRIFEFYFGMVLARLFQLHGDRMRQWIKAPWRDLALLAGFVSTYFIVLLKWKHGILLSWIGPHLFLLLAYGWILWFLSMGGGFVSRLFSLKAVSAVGRSSFYPYLWHLPLISIVIIVSQELGFSGFFKLWWQPIVFLVFLYGLSAVHLRAKVKSKS